ncbi:bifunctional diguanylate cyclase/phosphodiesterase [Caenispirillum bisanense]|uniref:Diguanylate cyclase/phosphodiesterase n=1 Tax=Caenispirillum bisanense TaxID=414052 RepID=A0A286GKS7_9PROT|nr:bifunctional diguanylate cyclase/phosphodiesterase [Caenispirillum bisanense]SOD96141.1 diguanylate cyclase/phosphodiesterase [Caenispirillum bisanense]
MIIGSVQVREATQPQRDSHYRPTFSKDSPVVLPPRWLSIAQLLDMALQPVVNIHTGRCLGYEALVRGTDAAGFDDIAAFLDACAADGVLMEMEVLLADKAMRKLGGLPHTRDIKLFLNVDGRTLAHVVRFDKALHAVMQANGVGESSVILEISERHQIYATSEGRDAIAALRRMCGKIAVDDFGAGYSGLPLLYFAQPEYIKIDRFFIEDIGGDSRKKLFLSHMVNVAHLLGILVVAEGVETEKEYYICKDIGIDLVQGWLVQRPTLEPERLLPVYPQVQDLAAQDRRTAAGDQKLIAQWIEAIQPLVYGVDMTAVFDRFRQDKTSTFFPVVDEHHEPLGIIRELDLKDYTYSLYGKELMSNKAFGRKLRDFVWKCPVADINTKAETILEVFSAAKDESEGIIIVDDNKYVGFLSARSLLRVISEKNLALARDQNPLTKLPGNNLINEYLGRALAEAEAAYTIAYIDFDNFKPFNDKYGFRQGDRAITLFADIMRSDLPKQDVFIGHVGGDDFFAAFRNFEFADAETRVRAAIERFRLDVESFYDEEARHRGYIVAKNREGAVRQMPLLSASAAIVRIPAGHAPSSIDDISTLIAQLKKEAKQAPEKLASAQVGAA